MKWIKYQIVQCTVGEDDVLVNKKVGYNEANLAIAEAEAYNGYEIIEDDQPDHEVIKHVTETEVKALIQQHVEEIFGGEW